MRKRQKISKSSVRDLLQAREPEAAQGGESAEGYEPSVSNLATTGDIELD